MRKAQREITDRDAVLRVLDECQTIRLGLQTKKFLMLCSFLSGGNKSMGVCSCISTAQRKAKILLLCPSRAIIAV